MSNYESIHFDMDGVIIDSESLHVAAERETCTRYGFDFDPASWAGFKGRTAEDIAEALINMHGDPGVHDVGEFVELKTGIFLELAGAELELIEGSLDFLEWARANHEGMSLVTSSNKQVQTLVVEKFGIEDMFDAFVTGDDVYEGKPSPQPYLMALELLGAEPDTSVVVEDSESGIRSARAAGCSVLAIATSHTPDELEAAEPDFIAVDYATARQLLAA